MGLKIKTSKDKSPLSETTKNMVYYRPQRSCEGYVFTGVCLSTGGVVSQHALHQVSRGVVSQHAWMPCRGGAWPRGCLFRGVPGLGGAWSRGGGGDTPRQQTATVADGTHPTGMYSC